MNARPRCGDATDLAEARRRERTGNDQQPNNSTHQTSSMRANPSTVARLRLTARCLGYWAVFVSDVPLVAELFDCTGRRVECWTWP